MEEESTTPRSGTEHLPEPPAILSAGGIASENFVSAMSESNETEELHKLIPEVCRTCSTAWLLATRGIKLERLANCAGKAETKLGELALVTCHLPNEV